MEDEKMEKMSLGSRMKSYEKYFSGQKAIPLLPIIARLDGKNFHNWTIGLDRPFDESFVEIMVETARQLVEESNAIVGYTQSDEITLIFKNNSTKSQEFFDGKLYKLTSVLASMCTAYFNDNVWNFASSPSITSIDKYKLLRSKPPALFDCRVFQVPNKEEAVNCLIWREQDAVRNSIQSVGQANFSHKQLHKKNCKEIQEMLFQEKGINWNHFRDMFKRGTYLRRITEKTKFSPKELERLPEKHEAKANPDLMVERSVIRRIYLPILASLENRIETIFEGADPVVLEE